MPLAEVFQKVCDSNTWAVQDDTIDVLLDGDRMQKIILAPFMHGGEKMIRAYSRIGSSEGLTDARLKSALSLNFTMPHGAVAIHENLLVLSDTFLLRDADENEVEASLKFIASTADRYEKLIYGKDQH